MAFKSREAYREYHRRWRAENPAKVKAAHATHALKHPEKVRARHRKYRYGLTIEAYEQLKAEQHGGCAICRRAPEDTTRGILVVDHDHETKRVRALLCNECNIAVAAVRERITTAFALWNYLTRHKGGG